MLRSQLMPDTFPYRTVHATFEGSCFGGSEIWNTGFYLGTEGADCTDPTQAAVDALAGYWSTFFTHANTKVNSNWRTDRVKMVTIDEHGDTQPATAKYYDYTTPPAGAATSAAFPPQITLVGTLRSTIVHGKASHGRMYLPGICAPIDSGQGTIFPSNRDLIGVKFKEFFTAVRGDAAMPGYPILIAKGYGLGPAAIGKYIYSVKVGSAYDTQRRRRNHLPETWYSGTI
jgi:hypothetical protein